MKIIEIKTKEEGADLGRRAAELEISRLINNSRGVSSSKNVVENAPEVEPLNNNNRIGKGLNDTTTNRSSSNNNTSQQSNTGLDASSGNTSGNASNDDSGTNSDSTQGQESNTSNGSVDNQDNAANSGNDVTDANDNGNGASGQTNNDVKVSNTNQNSAIVQDKYKVKELPNRYPKTKIYDGYDNTDMMNGGHVISKKEGQKIMAHSGIDENDPTWGGDDIPWAKLAKELAETGVFSKDPTYKERILGKIHASKKSVIDWESVLRDFLKNGISSYSDAPKDDIMSDLMDTYIPEDPYRENPNGKRVAVFIDTSGSVTQASSKILEQYCKEFSSLAKECELPEMDLYTFNTKVYNARTKEYNHEGVLIDAESIDDDWGLINVDTGGTMYDDCLDTIYDNYYEGGRVVDAIIFLTDTDLGYAFDESEYLKERPAEYHDAILSWADKSFWIILEGSSQKDNKTAINSVPKEVPDNNIILLSREEFEKAF